MLRLDSAMQTIRGVAFLREPKLSLAPWPPLPWWQRIQPLEFSVTFDFETRMISKRVPCTHIQ